MSETDEPLPSPSLAALDAWMAEAGLRRTRVTLAVLRRFVADPAWVASQADVADVLASQGVDANRVTLYRLLDRLVAAGLLTRQVGGQDRTWRFRVSDSLWQALLRAGHSGLPGDAWVGGVHPAPDVVPRFECDACHRQFPLEQASPPTQAVAQQLLQALASMGHHGQRVDVAIHGTCAVCVEPDGSGSPV